MWIGWALGTRRDSIEETGKLDFDFDFRDPSFQCSVLGETLNTGYSNGSIFKNEHPFFNSRLRSVKRIPSTPGGWLLLSHLSPAPFDEFIFTLPFPLDLV